MTASQVLEWLSSHWSAAWPIVSALLIVALRARTPEEWVALGERSPRVQGALRLLRAVGLDPVKALSALAQVVTGRAPERSRRIADTIAPPPPREGERGMVRVSVLLSLSGAVIVACVAGAVLAGCPRLPPVSGCAPLSYRCTDAGRPEVCSSSQRWQPVGDESCAAAGAVCVVDRTAHCAPHAISADGGAL